MDMDNTLVTPRSKEDLLRTAHVARIIDEQLTRQIKDTVVVDTVSFTDYFAGLHENQPQPLYRTKSVYKSGLVWLMATGAVTDDVVYDGADNAGNRKRVVSVNSKVFRSATKPLFEAAAGQLMPQDAPDKKLPLSEPVTVIKGDFAIHNANRISHKDIEIDMQPQMRNVAAMIMENSEQNLVTSKEMIEQKYQVYRATAVVSDARKLFQAATGRKNHDFFHNDRTIGYTFVV